MPEAPGLAYVAFVGLRPAAIAVALKTLGPRVKAIRLLTTSDEAKDLARALETFCARTKLPTPEPLAISKPADAAVEARHWLDSLDDGLRIGFHVDPGPGFASAKLARDVAGRQPILLSASEGKLVEIDLRDGSRREEGLVDLGLKELLDLYGVDARPAVDPNQSEVRSVTLGGALYLDVARERAGRLYGLREVITVSATAAKQKAAEVIANRSSARLKNLQPIMTLCSTWPGARADAASAGLLTVERSEEWVDGPEIQTRGATVASVPTAPADGAGGEGPPLLVWMGTDVSATLSAIWTHRPRLAIVLVDQGSDRAVAAARRLHANTSAMPVGSLLLCPVPFERPLSAGELKLATPDTAFNVSPGPRLQVCTAAARTSLPLWSIHRRAEVVQVQCLTGVGSREMEHVGLLPQLEIACGLKSSGMDLSEIASERDVLVALGRLLLGYEATYAGGGWLCLMAEHRDCALGHRLDEGREPLAHIKGLAVRCADEKPRARMYLRIGSVSGAVRNQKEGDWLEDLAAVCLADAAQRLGLTARCEITVGAELARPDWILGQRQYAELKQSQSNLAELDVVARIGSDLFALECKTKPGSKELSPQRLAVTAQAQYIGRFCIPIAVRPFPSAQERTTYACPRQGAAVLDLDVLLDPKRLAQRLTELAAARRRREEIAAPE